MSSGEAPSVPPGFAPGGRFDSWRPAPAAFLLADVDGTLVGASGAPSDAVVAAARAAADAGLPIGFATGRMRMAVASVQERLRLPGPHVVHNGAEVRADRTTIARWPLSPDELATVFRLARELDLYVELYVDDGYFVNREDDRARAHWTILGAPPAGVAAGPGELPGPAIKATFALFDGTPIDQLIRALEQAGVAAGPAGSPITPDITYVNATDPAVDKGRALRAVAAHLGVALDAVWAVGDAPNDIPMLTCAGTAIAMGQASADVKAAAHLLAPPVEEDGAAAAIRLALRHATHQAAASPPPAHPDH